MSDDDMGYSDTDDSRSSYSSSTYYYRYGLGARAATPPRAEPVLGYDVQYVEGTPTSGKTIDLAFVLDCTGSMQRYINATRDHVIGICDMIRGEEGLNGPDDLRVVNYRDHPPQDNTYVYKCNPFSSDIPRVQEYLKGLMAAGGGDGPEAVTSGLAATLTDLKWRKDAAKMVVLIADAPPHGIGEPGDQIKNGDPFGHDPLVIARTMAQHGIVLFMVACEDTLSGYRNSVDFFQALCNMTSGMMLPLTTADLLAMTIVGSVLENMDMERLITEIGYEVAQRIKQKGETMQSVEEVAQELHERLLLRNEQTKHIHLPEVYKEDDNAKQNVSTWMNAQFIHEVVDKLLPVPYKRLTDKFRKQNYEQGYVYTPGGRLPPRRPVPGAPPTPSSPEHPASPPRSSLTSMSGAGSPASPPRKVISSFKAFGSSSPGTGSSSPGSAKPLSVFGAPMLATGPGGGMFGSAGMTPAANGGMRGGRDDDDDDDDDDDRARFTKSNISLEQARRIATQSVFRAGRLG